MNNIITQTLSINTQTPFRAVGTIRDQFVKVDGVWKEQHNIGYIAIYNGETITTAYISSTGYLTTGATVIYVLATPTFLDCTTEQIALLEQMQNIKLYDGINNIYSTDTVSPYKSIKYIKNIKNIFI